MSEDPDNKLTLVFPNLPYFSVDPSVTALIIVDMQKLDAHPDYGSSQKPAVSLFS